MPSFWIETLGCPKNLVDSAKLAGFVETGGYEYAEDPEAADLIIVNTCAFIESARAESIEVILELSERRRPGAKVVVTGCMAERYPEELEVALPEVDLVAGFGESPMPVSVQLGARPVPSKFDLLLLPRPSPLRRGRTSRSPRGATAAVGSVRFLPSVEISDHDPSTRCWTRRRSGRRWRQGDRPGRAGSRELRTRSPPGGE